MTLRGAAIAAALMVPALSLAACTADAPEPEPQETEIPDDLATAPPLPEGMEDGVGTPLEDRVATIGLLNKRNNLSQDLEMKPGESKRVGNVIVRLSACEKTAPWEDPPETGAFVQVLVNQRASVSDDLEWHRIFSGWLFKNSPSVNVVEHPIYDVWVKDCAMTFPGEEESPAPAASASASTSE